MYLPKHWKIKQQRKCSSYNKGEGKGKPGEKIAKIVEQDDRRVRVGMIVVILKITENKLNTLIF